MSLFNTVITENNLTSYNTIVSHFSQEPYNLLFKDQVIVTDTNEKLGELYIINIDKDKPASVNNSLVRQCHGLILEKGTNNIVCYALEKFDELPPIQDSENNISENWQNVTVEEMVDGTVIKLYYYCGMWRVATTRCINAFEAYWINKRSFGELFMEACKDTLDFSMLDPGFCYT